MPTKNILSYYKKREAKASLFYSVMVNYNIKCNTLRKIKKFIQISGRIELPHN